MGKRLSFKKINFFILDLISLNSPLAIVIVFSLILLLLLIVPTSLLSYSPIRPFFKEVLFPTVFLGKCPDSGFLKDCNVLSTGETRGLSRILHGDISGALEYNKLSLLVFVIILSLIVVNIIKIFKRKE
jgi:hypothetical protein